MPKLEITTDAAPTVEPEVAARLDTLLRTYLDLKFDADLLYSQMEEEKRKMKGEMELYGLEKLSINGTPCTIVGGESSKLNKLKFVELGGSLAMLENATEKKPKKKYLRIGEDKE